MIPGSRGSAGVVALVFATALILAGLWFGFVARDSATDARLFEWAKARRSGSRGPDAEAMKAEADALSRKLEERNGALSLPDHVIWSRAGTAETPPVREALPRVKEFDLSFDGTEITLSWSLANGAKVGGFIIRRIDSGSASKTPIHVDRTERRWSSPPVDSLRGERKYRLSVIAGDGSVADVEEKQVSFRVDYHLSFLGTGESGSGRFRLSWDRGGVPVRAEFRVEPGHEIGGALPAAGAHPALDLRTGLEFFGFAGRRRVETRKVEVPRFLPSGVIEKDRKTGQVVFEVREVSVPVVELGATVAPLGGVPKGSDWLPKAKD